MKLKVFLLVGLMTVVSRGDILPPRPATQAEVNAGTATKPYVSPATLAGRTGGSTTDGRSITNLPGLKNVRDFGATGVGADDTAAFVAAQSAAGTTNGIYVPPGIYGITGPFILTNNWLVGAGQLSKIILLNNTVTQTHLLYATNDAGNQVIRDIWFHGSSTEDFSGSPSIVLWGITHNSSHNGEISHCFIDGFYAPIYVIGVNSTGTRPQNALYSFNTTSNAYYGIWLSVSNVAEFVRIEGNTFQNNQTGVQNDTAANVLFLGNFVIDSIGYAINADGSGTSSGGGGSGRGHSVYTGNTIGHTGSGVRFLSLSLGVFKNNLIGGGNGSFILAQATNCIVENNWFQLGASGVVVAGGQSNVVANNQWFSTPARTYDPTNCFFNAGWDLVAGKPLWETYANSLIFPATNAVPFIPVQGAGMFSDGTNLIFVLQNSAGTKTTNKVTFTSWP